MIATRAEPSPPGRAGVGPDGDHGGLGDDQAVWATIKGTEPRVFSGSTQCFRTWQQQNLLMTDQTGRPADPQNAAQTEQPQWAVASTGPHAPSAPAHDQPGGQPARVARRPDAPLSAATEPHGGALAPVMTLHVEGTRIDGNPSMIDEPCWARIL